MKVVWHTYRSMDSHFAAFGRLVCGDLVPLIHHSQPKRIEFHSRSGQVVIELSEQLAVVSAVSGYQCDMINAGSIVVMPPVM